MEDEFTRAVEDGLKLAKRVYAGKERQTAAPPRQPVGMEKSAASLLPTAPMLYAVIGDPAIVDNPDVPSYQPHVYGRCDPPALIPLQMKEIAMEVDCYLDTAFVVVRGRWRVHCVMGSRRCDCRLVVPMGEQGSILGAEVEFARRSYSTQVIQRDDQKLEKFLTYEHKAFLKTHYVSLTIPQVDGGCDISLKITWSQKLTYTDGLFSIKIPFNFPEYVIPFAKIVAKREKIQLNVNSSTEKEVIIQKTTHALKEKSRHVGRFSFFYEANVENWSIKDFEFSYSVLSSDIYGGVLLKYPTLQDHDQRNVFCLYLYPGGNQIRKAFRKEMVFLVDISGSMQGKPLDCVKNALLSVLSDLAPADYFNIIAFNEDMCCFSSSLEPANEEMIENATQWVSKKFIAYGGTNIMQPINEASHMLEKNSFQAMGLLSDSKDYVPYIFLITDGAVEDERAICHAARTVIENRGSLSPRICTFGIGTYCNHYFLQMLSSIGRGQYSAAYDQDSIEYQMQKWFRGALFPVVTNITVDAFDKLDAYEVYPLNIPDLLAECPLILSGRYEGKFPQTVKAEGRLADMSSVVLNLKVESMGDIPLEKVFAKKQIDLLTAQAWLSESKQLEEKVSKLSIQSGIPSEYTYMIFLPNEVGKQEVTRQKHEKKGRHNAKDQLPTLVHYPTIRFGSPLATAENLPPCRREPKQADATLAMLEKAVSCCGGLGDCCCIMCCIKTCSKMSDQCVIALTQFWMALSCFACSECCMQLCCDGD